VPCGGALLVETHLPAVHVCDEVHVVPHLPQLELSVCVSTQALPQSVPVPQTHTLLVHVALDGHTLPQLPQLLESLVVSTHTEPHIVPLHVFVVPLSCCC
jgi:hypothetical protein